jgi:hypothetical protein
MSSRLIPVRDIQFGQQYDPEKMRRLVEALAFMTSEVRKLQQTLGASGVGEVNTGANVGTGVGLFRNKTGLTLNFRSLLAGSGVSIAVVGDDVQISVGAGGSGYPAVLGHAGI